MDEREVALAESALRGSLASLDGIAVPTLSAVRAGRQTASWRRSLVPLVSATLVLVAAIAVGQGLALWRADRSSSVAATALPSATRSDQRYLDVDGYRFTISAVTDARYGMSPPAAAYVSAVPGVGVRCDWSRTGADVAKATEVWGTKDEVASLGGSAPLTRGTNGDRTHGVPAAAIHGQAATMVCGIEDETGEHGVVIDLFIAPDGTYTVRSLSLTRWSGILGDAAAVAPCTGKAGSANLVAAFVSTASEVADWVENAGDPSAPHPTTAFRSMVPTAPVYVCYFSGSWAPPVGPPGPGRTERPIDYDRALYFVDANGTVVPPSKIGSSGPSANIPLRRPEGRF